MKKLITTNNLSYVIAAILAIHMVNFPFSAYPHLAAEGPTWYGLDVSWQMMLNYANIQDWVWGKDIIYTYGPLGFLATRLGWGVSRWVFLLADIALVLNFFFVFQDYIKASVDKILAVFILGAITLLLGTHHGSGLAWISTLFIYYWFYKTYTTPRFGYFVVLSLLIVIAFYIKVNTGIVNIAFLCAHLANLVIFKKIKLGKALAVLAFTAAAIGLIAFALHVNLPGYVKGSLETIKGYVDVMGLYNTELEYYENNVRFLFKALVVLYLAYMFVLVRRRQFSHILYVLISFAYIFLLKKQATVRADIQHLSEFVMYVPLVLIFGNLLYFKGNTQRYFLGGALAITLFALLVYTSSRRIDYALADRFTNKKAYFAGFKDYPTDYLDQADKRFIPGTLLKKIGNNSIDVFPWDCAYLFQHKLNYTPRPAFQSFAAYTGYLEERNYDFYVSKAPEFILYDYDAIDGRHPFNDETLVNFFLTKNYTVSDTFTSNSRLRLLLRKNEKTARLNFSLISKKQVAIEEEVPIAGTNFLRIDLKQNFKGKLLSSRFRPEFVHISYLASDGNWYRYRTSAELLRSGIMVDRLVNNVHDYTNYIYNKDAIFSVNKVRIEVDKQYYDPQMSIEFYNVN